MRHPGLAGLRAAIGALALAGGGDRCVAAPLDFLFGGPPLASRPAYRLRRRPAPPLTRGDVPLPVPRPHFPDDPKSGAQAPIETLPARTAERPSVVAPAGETQPAKPAEAPPSAASATDSAGAPSTGPAASGGGVPLPPLKPEEISPHASQTPPAPPAPPIPPEKPADLAPAQAPDKGEPGKAEKGKTEAGKPAAPAVAPSGATTSFTPRAPEDDPQCPSRLQSQKVGIETTDIGPQKDPRCTVVEPVHLDDVTLPDGTKIAFPDRPTIACVTADAFASYVRDLLSPLAKGTFGSPVTAVWTGPGLECRARDSIFGAKLSAHGQGLAIDIAQLKLADGRIVEVGTPKTEAETAFETAARAGACGYFHTVLGPGSDAYHRTHWHFDLEVRGTHGDSKYCK